MLAQAGFEDVRIDVKENGRDIVKGWIPGSGAEKYVTSAYVTATKPRRSHGFRDACLFGLAAPPKATACCAPPPPAPTAPKAAAPAPKAAAPAPKAAAPATSVDAGC